MVGLGVFGLLVQSCSSSSSEGNGGGAGGTAGAISGAGGLVSGSGGTGGTGGRASGVSGSDAGGDAPSIGGDSDMTSAGSESGGAPSGTAGANGMGDAGVGGEGVADATCVRASDCLPICQRYGWPEANCFGAIKQYCFCKSTTADGPSCTIGTTDGCPAGTQCYGGKGCMPYGTATDGDPCDNGDECAVDYSCVRYGNPLPNGNYSSCRHHCDNDHPLPADCYSCTSGIYCDPFPAGAAGSPG